MLVTYYFVNLPPKLYYGCPAAVLQQTQKNSIPHAHQLFHSNICHFGRFAPFICTRSSCVAGKPNTINQQFEDMMESSNTWQEYKVVKRTTLDLLQRNTQDSLNGFKTQVSTFDDQLDERNTKISSLNTSLKETQNTLEETRANVSSIGFLGIQMSKGGYKSLMWIIVAILALALAFLSSATAEVIPIPSQPVKTRRT